MERSYYSRKSHETSVMAIIIIGFVCFGGFLLGGVAELIADGIIVYIAMAIGMILGLFTIALSRVSGLCSQAEEEMKK